MLNKIISAVQRKPATIASVFDFEAALIALSDVAEQQTAAARAQDVIISEAHAKRKLHNKEAVRADALVYKLKSLLDI